MDCPKCGGVMEPDYEASDGGMGEGTYYACTSCGYGEFDDDGYDPF